MIERAITPLMLLLSSGVDGQRIARFRDGVMRAQGDDVSTAFNRRDFEREIRSERDGAQGLILEVSKNMDWVLRQPPHREGLDLSRLTHGDQLRRLVIPSIEAPFRVYRAGSDGPTCISYPAMTSPIIDKGKRELKVIDRMWVGSCAEIGVMNLDDRPLSRDESLMRILCGFRPSCCLVSTPLGLVRSALRVDSCCARRSEREGPDNASYDAEKPRGFGTALSGIRRLPLGAKIGVSVVCSLLAWLIQARAVILVLDGRWSLRQGALQLLLTLPLLIGPGILWWRSST